MPRKTRAPLPPPPARSARTYLRLPRAQARLFRYLLEGRDNLAYTSVVDRQACILKVVCAPGQETALRQCLEELRGRIPWEFIPV